MNNLQVVNQAERWSRPVRAEYIADMLVALQTLAGNSAEFGFLNYLLRITEQEAKTLARRSHH